MLSFKNYINKIFSFSPEKLMKKGEYKTYKNVHGNKVHFGSSKKTGGKVTILTYGEDSDE